MFHSISLKQKFCIFFFFFWKLFFWFVSVGVFCRFIVLAVVASLCVVCKFVSLKYSNFSCFIFDSLWCCFVGWIVSSAYFWIFFYSVFIYIHRLASDAASIACFRKYDDVTFQFNLNWNCCCCCYALKNALFVDFHHFLFLCVIHRFSISTNCCCCWSQIGFISTKNNRETISLHIRCVQ